MKRVSRKETTENNSKYMMRSKDRHEKVSLSLTMDLITEILTKLPPISVCKLIFVSKLWLSTIQGKFFTDLYLTRSLTRPLLIFQFYCPAKRHFCSSSPENLSHDHSITPKTIPGLQISPPVRGLICCRDNDAKLFIVGNPSTGQFLTLPRVEAWMKTASFFGYDPVNDLYKVFNMTLVKDKQGCFLSSEHQVYTLGAQNTWRMIECKCPHYPLTQGICNNGVVYYGAWSGCSGSQDKRSGVVVSLDMRSEEFSTMTLPEGVIITGQPNLVSYNGAIAFVNQSPNGRFDLWVLMDASKQEWTKISLLVPCWEDLVGKDKLCCRGTISSGELVFEPCYSPCKYFIICYDSKKNKARRVDVERSRDHCVIRTRIFVDHVESPMFLPRTV
ncbi:unnamed protein product [Microthlaspi erraticum]|uniref:F-box domain-containing protein n=1 Tax=Microthlaspi erraticum TaxID=1685480 RepID=A0A6D2KD33_9BRAS|nr:unnamed protein product [Microthlaspi erraticum]